MEDANAQNIVSPRFVVASQRGESIPGPDTAQKWSAAVERCQTYYEDPYPAGNWRLPTFGELQFMYALHVEEKSALKKIFKGGGYGLDAHRYWSAWGYWSKQFPNEWVHQGMDTDSGGDWPYFDTTTCKTRCVYDLWREQP